MTPAAAPTRSGGRRWWAGAALLAIIATVLSIVAASHRRHDPKLEILDEVAHVDYVVALHDGHLPRYGDRLHQEVIRLVDCVGAELQKATGDCAAHERDPRAYGADGYNYEVQHPPLGYLPYVLTTDTGHGPRRLIATMRHGGMVWTAIGAAAIVWAAWAWGLGLLQLSVLLGTGLLSAWFVEATAVVNNDAGSVAFGAATLAVVALGRTTRRRVVILGLVVGLLGGLTKGTFIVAPLAEILALVLAERFTGTAPAGRSLDALLGLRRFAACWALLVGCFGSFAVWSVVQRLRATVSLHLIWQVTNGFTHADHPKLSSILSGYLEGLGLLNGIDGRPINRLWSIAVLGFVTTAVATRRRHLRTSAGPTVADVTASVGEPDVLLIESAANAARGWGILAGISAIAVGWPVITYLQGHYDIPGQVRYCMPLLPAIGLLLCRMGGRGALVVFGAAFPLVSLAIQLQSQ